MSREGGDEVGGAAQKRSSPSVAGAQCNECGADGGPAATFGTTGPLNDGTAKLAGLDGAELLGLRALTLTERSDNGLATPDVRGGFQSDPTAATPADDAGALAIGARIAQCGPGARPAGPGRGLPAGPGTGCPAGPGIPGAACWFPVGLGADCTGWPPPAVSASADGRPPPTAPNSMACTSARERPSGGAGRRTASDPIGVATLKGCSDALGARGRFIAVVAAPAVAFGRLNPRPAPAAYAGEALRLKAGTTAAVGAGAASFPIPSPPSTGASTSISTPACEMSAPACTSSSSTPANTTEPSSLRSVQPSP